MNFESNLEKKEDSSFILKVTIPSEEVKTLYQNLLQEQAKQANIKGFRQGKAPEELVENKIGKDKLDDLLLEKVIKKIYPEAVKKHDLRPIIPPKLKLVSTSKNKDWEINFTSCELPKVKLNEVKEKIEEMNAQSNIWTPDDETKQEKKKKNKDEQIQKILNTILKNVEINLPDILIERELNRKLVNLVDQVNQAGLEMEQYLSSKGTSIEELKKQFRQEITNSWKIDLTLEKISDEENIEISEEDTKKVEESKMNPYLAAKILRRKKTLEYLTTL